MTDLKKFYLVQEIQAPSIKAAHQVSQELADVVGMNFVLILDEQEYLSVKDKAGEEVSNERS